ncbi:hypothetical protein C4097_06795 [Clostridioides difficile]|uniref:GntR family transcriptional regulator n=1 Tax=Clostridioides sp. ZZV15-6598 TaxID=2811501 RepID=UPI001D124ABE|nr:GntR family transcriptional regulator [Clostridioides sp. ZZV15-6598]MDB3084267.1 hypothetical protein [Clostridioides difficile]
MIQIRRSYVINHESQEITFDLNFFKALLIEKPTQIDRDLSILTLRVAFLLMSELDEVVAKKIPPRKILAEQLNVSRNSITNSLIQLEECGFLIRKLDNIHYRVCVDEDAQKELDAMINKELELAKKNRKFSGEFLINSNYNYCIYSDVNDLDNPEFLKKLAIQPKKLQKDIDRINDLERRVSLIENIFKINI